jgi:hypothetical protein
LGISWEQPTVFPSYDGIVPKVRNLRHRIFPPSLSDDKAVARRGKWTDRDSQAGSIPACHISPVKVCDGVATVTTSRYAYHDDELAG